MAPPEPAPPPRHAPDSAGGRPASQPEVELFTRQGCHLCEQAEAVLREQLGRRALRVTDIDTDPALQRRYGVRVPVVAIDGREVFELVVPAAALQAALRAAAAGDVPAAGPEGHRPQAGPEAHRPGLVR